MLDVAIKVLAYTGSTLQLIAVIASGAVPLIWGAALLWAGTSLSIHLLDKQRSN